MTAKEYIIKQYSIIDNRNTKLKKLAREYVRSVYSGYRVGITDCWGDSREISVYSIENCVTDNLGNITRLRYGSNSFRIEKTRGGELRFNNIEPGSVTYEDSLQGSTSITEEQIKYIKQHIANSSNFIDGFDEVCKYLEEELKVKIKDYRRGH